MFDSINDPWTEDIFISVLDCLSHIWTVHF